MTAILRNLDGKAKEEEKNVGTLKTMLASYYTLSKCNAPTPEDMR